jgi:hypothetical protein
VRPHAGLGALTDAGAPAGATHIRAREPGGEDRDPLDLGPVNGGDVAEVGHARVAVGEHLGRGRVVVGDPREVEVPAGEAEGVFEAAVPGAERAHRRDVTRVHQRLLVSRDV